MTGATTLPEIGAATRPETGHGRPKPGYDAIVIGGGHNGLIAAALLGRAGMSVLLVEARERLGGAAETSELLPGASVPTLAHTVGRLRPSLVRTLDLRAHGLRFVAPDAAVFAPRHDGRALTLWRDPTRTAAELLDAFPADSAAFLAFDARVRRAARVLSELARTIPPDLRRPSAVDALSGLRLVDAARRLGRVEGLELLRLLPMAVADLVTDSLADPHLRAVVAGRGILFTAMSPRSAGTSAVFLADSAGNEGGATGQTVYARGGPGAVAEALAGAAARAGVEARTGSEVTQVTSRDGRATGVVLASGDEVRAPIIVAAIEPKRLLTGLVDPMELGPTLRWRASNYRTPGATAKVNLALSGLPAFRGAGPDAAHALAGRIVLTESLDDLERASDAARYGRIPERPHLEVTIPSLADPALVDDRARAAGVRHVMSVIVQYAPYRLANGDWDARREELGDVVLRTLEDYAPGTGRLVVARQVITPLDLEREYGMTGGHPLHGEPGLDQFFAWRPLLGWARHRMPLAGLYLAGSGAHPGGGVTGAPAANAVRAVLADRRRP